MQSYKLCNQFQVEPRVSVWKPDFVRTEPENESHSYDCFVSIVLQLEIWNLSNIQLEMNGSHRSSFNSSFYISQADTCTLETHRIAILTLGLNVDNSVYVRPKLGLGFVYL